MANTYVDYTATAAQTDFAFSFDYLEDEHVTVEIDGVVQLTSDYSIVTTPSTKVVLNVGATAGQIVRVRRKSQPDTNLVDFVNGSVLTESELDRAYLHNRYLAEEISELNDQSLQVEAGGTQWDAKSLRIKNVGTPTDTTDASTKDYVDSKVNQVSSGASSPPTKWVFTGTAGANTTYSVTGAEVNGDTAYDVSIDGAVKEPTTDYTVDPDTDTLTIVPTLSGGEDIVVIERGFGVAVTGTVGSSQIQDGAITTAKIENGAITTAKIENGAITSAKISTTDTNFNVQSNGRVGIGTTIPGYELEVSGWIAGIANALSTDAVINLAGSNSTNYGAKVRIKATSESEANESSSLTFSTTNSLDVVEEKMRIDPDGNVGIKNVDPDYALDVTGDINVRAGNSFKTNGANLLLDEDTMTSNSDTQGATQQSIKAYVDSQVVSKYTAAWATSHGVTVADGATLTITHNLGTTDVQASIYVNSSASDVGAVAPFAEGDAEYGWQVTSLTSNTITVQLGTNGYHAMNTSGVGVITSYASKYIKVVVIG
jgi:hypothetical protein